MIVTAANARLMSPGQRASQLRTATRLLMADTAALSSLLQVQIVQQTRAVLHTNRSRGEGQICCMLAPVELATGCSQHCSMNVGYVKKPEAP
jgi:hypothetical protein